MRQVAYALLASCALMLGVQTSASAGCYGECNGYQDHRYGPRDYERYSDRPVYRARYRERDDYDEPRYHTTYYERGPEYRVGYSDGGYYGDRPYYRSYRSYGYGYGYDGYRGYGYYAPTVRYGGAWSQTGPSYASWGGCHTAYIPYGWTWYRAHKC